MRRKGPEANNFRLKVARAFRDNTSRVILALDIQDSSADAGLRQARTLLRRTIPYLCGVKLGRQTVLNLGTGRTRQIIRLIHDNQLPCIIDDKLNDIGSTNTEIARAYFRLGFDALTANPFVGWKEGLEPLFDSAHEDGKGILLLVYMSHPGAPEGYGQKVMDHNSPIAQYVVFARRALAWQPDGVIVGATWPKVVVEVKKILGERIPIYSPGVGKQGGDLKRALLAGTDYFIIGRSITQAASPEKCAAKFAQLSVGHA